MENNMKDSGIEWIGEIPEKWDVTKVKYLAHDEKDSLFIDGDWIESDVIVESGIRYLTTGNVGAGYYKEQGNGYISQETFNKLNCLKVLPNDLMISRLNEPIGRSCIVPDGEPFYVVAVDNVILRPDSKYDKKFIMYCMNSDGYAEAGKEAARGSTMQRVSRSLLGNFYIPTTDLNEQQVIANFLDKKVGQVDDILTDLNKQVELLNQYRDSVIYEATSKGLNKNNEYQSIDNEWYPQIPAHWRFMAVKRLTSVLTCGVASTPEYVDENNGVLFLSAQNIQNNKLDLSIRKYVPISLHKTLTKNRKPQKGDILQVRVGATIGKCAIVDIDEEFSVYVSLSHIRANQNMHNRFLNYIIGTDMFKEMVSLDIDYAGTQGNLNVADLREVRIPVPPIQEQQAIADYLDKKCTQIDDLIIEKQKQIEKMESYKKSLIYEYVTGKKRVRV